VLPPLALPPALVEVDPPFVAPPLFAEPAEFPIVLAPAPPLEVIEDEPPFVAPAAAFCLDPSAAGDCVQPKIHSLAANAIKVQDKRNRTR
jgi:hypothetical protein